MGFYPGANNWPTNIYQFEQTDPVQGGPTGIDNQPLKELADRTTWLRAQMGLITHLPGDIAISGTGTQALDKLDAGKLVIAGATGILNITLPNAADVEHGTIIPVSSYANAGCVVNMLPIGGQLFQSPAGNVASLSMHNKEHLFLVALTNHYKVLNAIGNFYSAGEEIKARKVLNNTLAFTGQLLQRAQYPRLWAFVSSLTMNQEVITDALWNSHPLNYKGFFSTGDGVSTFRLPDERGMSDRMLDLGRGVDINRLQNYAGGYEHHMTESHTHNVSEAGDRILDDVLQWRVIKSNTDYSGLNADIKLKPFGGNETIVKNIGKYNLIKF